MDKKYNKKAIKDMLYGTINEICQNSNCYYRGIDHKFDQLHSEGKDQLLIALEQIIPLISQVEDEIIREKAIALTLENLKDDKK